MTNYFSPEIKYKAKISFVLVSIVSILAATVATHTSITAASILNLYLPFVVMQSFYLTVRAKYILATVNATLWAIFSYTLAVAWIRDLAAVTTTVFSYIAIFGIAILPGFMNMFMITSLFLDLRPKRKSSDIIEYPPITILVAAYNEQDSIVGTLESIERQGYGGTIRTIVINDGSRDDTARLVKECMSKYSWLTLLDLEQNVGKRGALNRGLELVDTDLTITIDGDSYLYSGALQNLVERYLSDPPNTAAVAGAVLVRNSRKNWVTRIQEWDYFLGIAAVKRIQSLYHGTLVAQGAFSLYRTSVLRECGGWPHSVGEDIVLSWDILRRDYRIGFCEDAYLFTNVPERLGVFIKQRQRWSRGLVEAFKAHWVLLFKPRMTTMYIWWNFSFLFLDVIYTFVFVPGVILACFGLYYIAGPMTLIVLPVAMLVNWVMYGTQVETFFHNNLKVRKNRGGFILYMLVYSLILQPVCVIGYIKELLWGGRKSWGTK